MSHLLLMGVHAHTQREAEFDALGLEGVSHLRDYMSEFGNVLTGHISNLLESTKPAKVETGLSRKLTKLLDRVPYAAVAPITVYHPSGLNDYMLPYLSFMESTLVKLKTLDERLYTPLSDFLGELISQPDTREKMWAARNLELVDAEGLVETYNTFFDPKIRNHHDTLSTPFENLYRTNNDFVEASTAVTRMIKILNDIDFAAIREAETALAERVKAYVKVLEENPDAALSNRQAIQKLAESVNAVARETELFALVVYGAKVAQTAVNDSAGKLEDNLK